MSAGGKRAEPASPAFSVVLHSERPELWDRIPALFAGVVPEYNLHGDISDGEGDYWNRLFKDFPEYQFVLYDEARDDILGAGRSVPRSWDGTAEGLGPGLDDSIAAAFRDLDAGRAPGALCALGVEVAPGHQGRGLSGPLLRQLVETARDAGLSRVIVPVRPTWKDRYPLVPIERYAAWQRADGAPFDPWIRTQVRAGGTLSAASGRSSRITGTVAEWESWTGMAFPDDGDYVFPHGLATVRIDHARDLGAYWEPGVWILHDAAPAREP
ncbi:GNAT family N-acetyltransferase [Streptomyces sp. N2-109]|uniref:GNAT family N-acetyltransferase n=1 Tax=Streptomyces gossypii TaxID=2883101 RepID=A0ABT2JVK7_9ACTN|nr:GNAT family N-acetyltransferase [Streptomyces gossypii]MCT2591776.1 GNAT family N-acetyltransferase [Streptomyces gossypii]